MRRIFILLLSFIIMSSSSDIHAQSNFEYEDPALAQAYDEIPAAEEHLEDDRDMGMEVPVEENIEFEQSGVEQDTFDERQEFV